MMVQNKNRFHFSTGVATAFLPISRRYTERNFDTINNANIVDSTLPKNGRAHSSRISVSYQSSYYYWCIIVAQNKCRSVA
ncbi:hypothetical protein QE152_g23539 [Popillia japonica]|uniref:Uncharacterized protein n=1 Tax=Popillia japonica TaxID=7064 RepID=A0AAW1KGS3_POPJA